MPDEGGDDGKAPTGVRGWIKDVRVVRCAVKKWDASKGDDEARKHAFAEMSQVARELRRRRRRWSIKVLQFCAAPLRQTWETIKEPGFAWRLAKIVPLLTYFVPALLEALLGRVLDYLHDKELAAKRRAREERSKAQQGA